MWHQNLLGTVRAGGIGESTEVIEIIDEACLTSKCCASWLAIFPNFDVVRYQIPKTAPARLYRAAPGDVRFSAIFYQTS